MSCGENSSAACNGSCAADQSFLLNRHPWLFVPSSLSPLVCMGSEGFCSDIQQRNRPFAATILPYSALFCAFNALNIFSNALCYAVFSKHDGSGGLLQSIVVLLLKALSLLEIMFHLFFLLYHATEYWRFSSALSFTSLRLNIGFCGLINSLIVLQTCFHIARNWVVVIISSFRYEAVCRAMQPAKLFTSERRVHAILAAIVLCSFCISLPRFFFFLCVVCERPGGEYSLDALDVRFGRELHNAFNSAYLIAGLLVFQTGGPILAVCLFSTCIMLSLRRHRQIKRSLKRLGDQSRSHQGSRGNLLVIILCVTFLVLEFPLFISKILYGKIANRQLDAFIVALSKFATLFDSFLNIFIYSISNKKFREDLRELVRLPKLLALCSRRRRPPAAEETVALQPIHSPAHVS